MMRQKQKLSITSREKLNKLEIRKAWCLAFIENYLRFRGFRLLHIHCEFELLFKDFCLPQNL